MTNVDRLEAIFGETANQAAVHTLYEKLSDAGITGTLYVGYPILRTADTKIFVDALLVSPETGFIAFDVTSPMQITAGRVVNLPPIQEKQDQIYAALYNKLNNFKELRSGRRLGIEISVITCHPDAPDFVHENDTIVCQPS